MRTICWVTPDCFVDVDIPIIPHILDEYDVTWVINFPWRNNRFKESDFEYLKRYKNLKIIFFHMKYYRHDPRYFFRNRKFLSLVAGEASKADIVYLNGLLSERIFGLLPLERTIFTAHDGSIKSIMPSSNERLYMELYPKCKYVNMFSEQQAELFRKNYAGSQVTVIPLAPKDYGKPKESLRKDAIGFVVFGTIHAEKNIPLVIEAANQLYEEGIKNFRVSINGQWKISDSPKKLIRHPEVFEIQTHLVDNKDIPNLYGRNHFALFAYKDMSQSGALKVAFNYDKPVVVSDLPGFKEEVQENVNGFFFKSEDLESLKSIMKKCIQMKEDEYVKLLTSTKEYIAKNYSMEAIIEKYKEMFAEVIND